MLTRFMRWSFNLAFSLLTDRDVDGLENLPPHGPYIMTINHLSYFDAPLMYGLIGGDHITGWAANKYNRHPLFGPIVRLGGGIFIRRGEVDRSALASAVEWLKQGKIFAMSPEGTRSKTGALAQAKTGAAYLAHQVNVPIVPAAISGTEKLARALLRLRRVRLVVRFGKLFRLPPLSESDRIAGLHKHTDEIMCRIAVLLPPAYRGFYAEHPRLQTLLTEASVTHSM